MAVSSLLENIAERLFHFLVAGKVQGVGRASPQHGDINATERSQEPFSQHHLLESFVHAPVLGFGVRLQALHPCLQQSTEGEALVKNPRVQSHRNPEIIEGSQFSPWMPLIYPILTIY